MIEGKSDIVLLVTGSQYAINSSGHPHPYLITKKYWFMVNFLEFTCPLPSKIPSFYNIMTPLGVEVWLAVLCSVLIVWVCFLVIDKLYKGVRKAIYVGSW